MRRTRSARWGVWWVLCAGVACVASGAWATTVRTLSGSELVTQSNEIVFGTVVGVRPSWTAGHRRIQTEVSIVVQATIKGAATDTLRLVQLGGVIDGVRYDVPGAPVYREGEEVLIFTWRDRKGTAQTQGLSQGKFAVSTGEDGVRTVLGLPAELFVEKAGMGRMAAEPTSSAGKRSVPLDQAIQTLRVLAAGSR